MYAELYPQVDLGQEYRIRQATLADIREIVAVHMASFRNFFLTCLGPRFLELLYTEIVKEQCSVFIVAVTPQGTVTGFAAGVSDQTSLFSRLAKKRWFAFCLASSGAALRHPGMIPRLFRAFRFPGNSATAACPALLMSLAVLPGTMKKGVGGALVRAFLREMARFGADAVCLKTDRDNNDCANMFYTHLGFDVVRAYRTSEGRWLNEYMIRISPRGGE